MTISRARLLRGATCLAPAGAAGPVAVPAARAADRDVVELMASRGEFQRFLTLCQRANISEELKAPGPFTVFAPPDAASGRIPESLVADLAGAGGGPVPDMVRLRAWMLFPAVQGQHPSAGWTTAQALATLYGGRLRVDVPQDASMRVLNATNPTLSTGCFGAGGLATNRIAAIASPDLVASNGTAHAIDNARLDLFPTNAPADPVRGRAVISAHIVEGMHPLSEFSGRTVTLTTENGKRIVVHGTDPDRVTVRSARDGGNGPGSVLAFWGSSTIARADIPASNGLVHIVDKPVLP